MSDLDIVNSLNQLERSHIDLIKNADVEIRSINKSLVQIYDEQLFVRDKMASLWMAVGLQFLVSCLLGILLYFKCRP